MYKVKKLLGNSLKKVLTPVVHFDELSDYGASYIPPSLKASDGQGSPDFLPESLFRFCFRFRFDKIQ